MRRLDGLPPQRNPTRYLVFPKGQLILHRPVAGLHSHVALSHRIERDEVDKSQWTRYRRFLCGRVIDTKTNEYRKYDWYRYRKPEQVAWDRVTCKHCLARKETIS